MKSTATIIAKSHPDAIAGLLERGLMAEDAEMEKDIGRVVKFINWNPSMGTVARDYTFTIIGVQKIHDGRLAYRVQCNGFDDTFGRPALRDEIKFIR